MLTTIHPELLSLNPEQLQAIQPYLWVFGGTVLAILACVLRLIAPKWPVFLLTLATAFTGITLSLGQLHLPSLLLFNGMMISDPFSSFFNIVFLASAGLTALASLRYLDREKLQHPEYY